MEIPCYRLHDKKSLYFMIGSLVFMSGILAVGTRSMVYASSEEYNIGYVHGCNDAKISDPDDRYINQPGKGPAFHTISFMNGYNDGFYLCTGNSEAGIQN